MAARPDEARRRFRHSIRFKLLLVSFSLLAIPVAGYLFLQETERFLRGAQEQNLLATARALASVIPDATTSLSGDAVQGSLPWHNLPLHTLQHAPELDGYRDEWSELVGDFTRYAQPDGSFEVAVYAARHARGLYLLFDVDTRQVRYGRTGDRIDIAFTGPRGALRRVVLQPQAPGDILARERLAGQRRTPVTRLLPRIRGAWQEHAGGYAVELLIPADMIATRLAFRVGEAATGLQLGNARLQPAERLGRLVSRDAALQRRLARLLPHGMVARVTDHEAIVLAAAGTLDAEPPLDADREALPWFLRQLILSMLPGRGDGAAQLPQRVSRLDLPPVEAALAGREQSLRHRSPDQDSALLSVAVPIRGPRGVVGSLLLEQTTGAILSIQNLALQRLFLITLALFGFTSLVLLVFASLLSTRIRRLRNRLDTAVSHDGRIVGSLERARSPDEIGDLQRSFAQVLDRLQAYNKYLEAMASRLAHELRTPLSIVRTSLDNADQAGADNQATYLARARDGAERLELILQRLREATRLEQSLHVADIVRVDLAGLLRHQGEAFAQVYPDVRFGVTTPSDPLAAELAPDLLCQALEKLVSNAVDFHLPGTAVQLELRAGQGGATLLTINQGPALSADIDLFQSMTSLREHADGQPHLGLGLYLVRLIAEFHGGHAVATNREDGRVACGLWLPLHRPRERG